MPTDGAQTRPQARPGFDEILAAIEPHLLSFGITRVGDLTGLDVIGVPVFSASRPNSRSLSVCQGKGLSEGHARLAAIMEGVEQALAERHEDLVSEWASQDEMAARGLACMPSASMLRSAPGERDRHRKRAWVAGVSMVGGHTVHVPFELVGFDLRAGTQWDHGGYKMTTVGLGAASSLADAALHALLEVVENDASAFVDIFGQLAGFARPIVRRPGRCAALDDLVAKVESAGLGCFFVDLTAHVALPTVAAFVTEPSEMHAGSGARSFAGFACRLSAEEAAIAALLEAVQSRLTQIAGARDDLSPGDYLPKCTPIRQLAGVHKYLDELPQPGIAPLATTHEKLRHALAAVRQAGAQEVVFVPLGGVAGLISGVRVLVSALQAAAGDGVVRISAAALDAMLARTRVPQ